MFDIKINGKAIRRFASNGNFYVEGRTGTQYTINLHNSNWSRRLFVISIDGINAVSGKPTDEDPHNGYIINGYGSLDLKGFRINDTDVAAFKFVKSNQSYAKEVTGSKQNNGVIGVKVYDEKIQPIPQYVINNCTTWKDFDNTQTPYYKCSDNYSGSPSSGSLCNTVTSYSVNNFYSSSLGSNNNLSKGIMRGVEQSAQAAQPEAKFNLGTGWGEKKEQKVIEVSFEVGNLVDTQIVYYASREELEKMGIDFGTTPRIRTMPSAFGEKKFCPMPKNWQG